MIRPTVPEDTPTLLALTQGTNVFKPHEIVALNEVLDDYHEFEHQHEHFSITCERDGRIIGFAYYARASMTDRAWYLYWIAVEKGIQAKGVGSELLREVEDDVRRREGRLLLIETSSLPHYDPTRRFYEKHHYDLAATIKDFYADGDDLIVFGKRLRPREPRA